ncbi:MAG: ATP-binding protein, partial [Opitutales bacterium]|nr:ATP-binding protein [Opitutales bacterium]
SVEMLGRILFNLTDNAVKYAFREYDDNTLTFRVHAEQKRLCIDVEDDGPGIPEKYRAEIFMPFERGAAREHAHGLGLGLPVSAEAAKILGGKLFLLTSDSSGTIFRLELPLL